jgi:uncharacterized repeat protein (TIGR02543 family)
MRTVGLKPHPGADSQRGTFILFIFGVALSFISAGTAAAPAPWIASSGGVIPTYSLSVTTPGGGNVLVNPSNPSYVSNAMVSISASAKSGWTFLGWSGDASGTDTTVHVTMTDNKCVQAIFGTSLATTTTGDGYVLTSPTALSYPYGSVVQLSAAPLPGNYFSIWAIAANSTTSPLLFVMTNANPSISALFNPLSAGQFSLTVTPNGAGNAAYTPRFDRYNSGQLVAVTATPDAGQDFIGWSGDATGTDNPMTVTMNQTKAITAKFTSRPRFVADLRGGRASESGFRITLVGQLRDHYQLEGSTNLASWTPVVTLTNSLGLSQYADSFNTNSSRRFYRALLLP